MKYRNFYGKRFSLEVGTPKNGVLTASAPVGCAVVPEGHGYYVIRLWTFPKMNLYLKLNEDKNDEGPKYTLYARKLERDGQVAFENPVGSASILPELKEYLEIKLRLPKDKVYLSLHPEQY